MLSEPTRTCRMAGSAPPSPAFAISDAANRGGYHVLLGVHRYFLDAANTGLEPGRNDGDYTLSTSNSLPGLRSLPLVYMNDGSAGRPFTAAAHELGHFFDLPHAGLSCGGNNNGQTGEAWPPYSAGRLQGVAMRRRQVFKTRVNQRVLDTDAAPLYDLMSYCASDTNRWLSPRNWSHVVAVLQAFRRAEHAGRWPTRASRPRRRVPRTHGAS